MIPIYYWRYDVSVDSQTGEFLETICGCSPEDNCSFKDAWIEDGKPHKLSESVLLDLQD